MPKMARLSSELRAEVVESARRGQVGRALAASTTWKLMSYVEVGPPGGAGLMTPHVRRRVGGGRGFAVYGDGEASLEING